MKISKTIMVIGVVILILIPATLAKELNITRCRYVTIVFKHNNDVITTRVRLIRLRKTYSRQFTIPKEIREKYNIKPGDEIEILEIKKGERSAV